LTFLAQFRVRLLTVFFLALVSLHADEANDLQKHLQQRFLKKVFMIRNFYGGDHLIFDSQGNLLQGDRTVGYEGCWSAAQIEVRKLEVKEDRLILRGPRVFGVYDSQKKQLSQFVRKQDVQVEIQLNPAQMDEKSLSGVLTKIFLTREDDLGKLIPDVWRAPEPTPAKDTATPRQDSLPSFKVGNGVTAPKPIHTPDPEYSEEARKAKYQGDVAFWFVVDEKGNVTRIRINQCLGLGLDEQAIRVLSKWKFEPATKNGQPVAVQMNGMMTFHLY
jgi:TonB family protein